MLHDFAVAVATFITIMGSVLAHDAQQLSSTVGNLLHPAPTAVTYDDASRGSSQYAAAASTNDPFHSVAATPEIPSNPATSPTDAQPGPLSQPIASSPPAVAATATISPPHPGRVLGESTDARQFATPLDLAALKSELEAELNARIDALPAPAVPVFSFSGPAASTPVSTETFAAGQKIDRLGNVTITNGTVNGLSGLTDTDIPDGITASNYLPLSGGTLSGDLSLSGTLTAGALSVAGISSSGALIGPFVTATSTTATSTFAGGVGIGTSSARYMLDVNGTINANAGSQTGPRNVGFSLANGQAVFTNDGNSSNLFVGDVVGANTTGSIGYYNTIFGLNSGANIADASSGGAYANSFFGRNAGNANTTGVGNNFFGTNAGWQNTTGSNNVVVGTNAGYNITTGSLNTFLGSQAGSASSTLTNATALGSNASVDCSNCLVLGNSANIGIASTTPGSLLSVGNTNGINFSTATSSFSSTGGINLAAGCFAIGGTCLSAASLGAATFAYPFPSNATTSGLLLLASSTIGGGAQTTGLTISGGATTTGNFQIGNLASQSTANPNTLSLGGTYSSTLGANPKLKIYDDGSLVYEIGASSGSNFDFTSSLAANFNWYQGATNAMRLTSAGALGIGTDSPAKKLHVFDSAASLAEQIETGLSGGQASLLLKNPGRTWQILVNGGLTGDMFNVFDATAGAHRMVIDSSGNVGIGNTSPTYKLDVTGLGHFTGLVDAASFIATSSSVASIFNGGFLSLASSTIGGGTQTMGLTISGGATTTGTAYFAGNVGIGTSTPGADLAIFSSTHDTHVLVQTQQASNRGDATLSLQRGTAGKDVAGVIYGSNWFAGIPYNGGVSTDQFVIDPRTDINGSPAKFTVLASGNVGIASTTPWRMLSVTGTVGFDGLTGSTGAGSLCLDANKQVVYNSASDNCLSSTRATKHDILDLEVNSLSLVDKLQPVSFVYNQGDGRTRYGFIAEDTANVDAHLATYDASKTVSGIDDRSILAVVIGAIKALTKKLDDLAATVTGFAEKFTTKELVAVNGNFQTLTASSTVSDVGTFGRLCVGDVCVTRDQFMSVFGASALSQPAAAADAPVSVGGGAPASQAAPLGEDHADTGSSTTTSVDEATTTPVSGNAPTDDDAEQSEQGASAPQVGSPAVSVQPVEQPAAPADGKPSPVNDNPPVPSAEAI